jgi:ribosome-associated toxin RatA of RatAB toxin-antitoxin module
MIEIHRSALILVPAEAMYRIINDVACYPEFLDGVAAGRVIEVSDTHMVGELTIRKAGFERTVRTRNQLTAPTCIDMKLIQGPLENFSGVWRITPLSELGCKVALDIQFDVAKGLTAMAFGAAFKQVANNMVDAFVSRAHELHLTAENR